MRYLTGPVIRQHIAAKITAVFPQAATLHIDPEPGPSMGNLNVMKLTLTASTLFGTTIAPSSTAAVNELVDLIAVTFLNKKFVVSTDYTLATGMFSA